MSDDRGGEHDGAGERDAWGLGAPAPELLDELGIGAFRIDHPTGRITWANDAFARIFGFASAVAAKGALAEQLYGDPRERAEIAARLGATPEFLERGIARIDVRRRRGDTGAAIDVRLHVRATRDATGAVAVLDCLAEEREPRSAVEAAFRASEARFRTVFETSLAAMALVDLDGRIQRVNAAMASFLGRAPEALAGADLFELFHVDDAPRRPSPSSPGADARVAGERRFVRPDGAIAWGSIVWSWLANEGGDAHSAVVVVHDVTERRRLEESLVRMDRLESIGLLAGGVAHDFNNALAVILGNIDLARRFAARGEAPTEPLAMAELAARRAREVAEQLIGAVKGTPPSRRAADLATIVREAATLCLGGTPVTLSLVAPPELSAVAVDVAQLGQAVQNVLLNAVQAMPSGGTIHAELDELHVAAPLPGRLAAGWYVRARIRDEGAGIPDDVRPHVFDAYFSTKPAGTGLGLATAHAILRRHGGEIAATSEPGRGATFTLLVPASSQRPTPAPAPALGPPRMRRARVLVMDDEPHLLAVTVALLRAIGFDAESARDGEAATRVYEAAREAGAPFDVVMLDLTVRGGMGGTRALARLRESDPGVRAILVTGHAEEPLLADPTRHGFAAALTKPYRVDELEAVLDAVLRG